MTLTKAQSRQRWKEVREHWCQWDPIGVLDNPDWPRDEYDAYLGPTLRYLENGQPADELAAYLTFLVRDHMGLGETGVQSSNPVAFAEKLHGWFQREWRGINAEAT